MDLLFELDWCEVAQRTVEPLVVVEDFDERDDSPADLGDRGPGLAVYQFLLESGEPALANGVVPALAFTRQALYAVMGFQQGTELGRGVLRPAVGTEDPSGCGWRAAMAMFRASQTSEASM